MPFMHPQAAKNALLERGLPPMATPRGRIRECSEAHDQETESWGHARHVVGPISRRGNGCGGGQSGAGTEGIRDPVPATASSCRARIGRALREACGRPAIQGRSRLARRSAGATKIYGAAYINADAKVKAQIKKLHNDGYGHYPVCIAKTQYSFLTDASARGAPSGHIINIREVRLAARAEFVVIVLR